MAIIAQNTSKISGIKGFYPVYKSVLHTGSAQVSAIIILFPSLALCEAYINSV